SFAMNYLDAASSEPADEAADPSPVTRRRKRLQHAGENQGNVVVAAAILRSLDQVVGGERQIGLERADDQLDVDVLYQVIEPVGAKHINVAGGGFVLAQMGASALVGA